MGEKMAELVIEVPSELESEIEGMPEIKEMIKEFIRLKALELELKRNKELQRLVLEALASKSKLTEKGALELGKKVKDGMFEELKEKGLI